MKHLEKPKKSKRQEILKIDAEMAEKIEVEVGNPHLKTDRKVEK